MRCDDFFRVPDYFHFVLQPRSSYLNQGTLSPPSEGMLCVRHKRLRITPSSALRVIRGRHKIHRRSSQLQGARQCWPLLLLARLHPRWGQTHLEFLSSWNDEEAQLCKPRAWIGITYSLVHYLTRRISIYLILLRHIILINSHAATIVLSEASGADTDVRNRVEVGVGEAQAAGAHDTNASLTPFTAL